MYSAYSLVPITSKSLSSKGETQRCVVNCQNQRVPDSTVQKFHGCQAPVAPALTQALIILSYTRSLVLRKKHKWSQPKILFYSNNYLIPFTLFETFQIRQRHPLHIMTLDLPILDILKWVSTNLL